MTEVYIELPKHSMENKQVYLYVCMWSFKDKFNTLETKIHTMLEKLTFYLKNMEMTV